MKRIRKMSLLLVLLLLTMTLTACQDSTEETTKNGQTLSSEASDDHLSAAAKYSVGSYVTFGTYPQTADGHDSTPIEWLVLEVDEANHKALLLSRYGLDAKPYYTWFTGITWETSTLRIWLNGEFLNKAFTEDEQKGILITEVNNSQSQGYSGWDSNGGNNTQDKIFLLSCSEVNKYFGVQHYSVSGSSHNMKSRIVPTAYAIKRRASTSGIFKTAEGTATGWWWLRSPGDDQRIAACVDESGSLSSYGVHVDHGCVRPALWINLESDIF